MPSIWKWGSMARFRKGVTNVHILGLLFFCSGRLTIVYLLQINPDFIFFWQFGSKFIAICISSMLNTIKIKYFWVMLIVWCTLIYHMPWSDGHSQCPSNFIHQLNNWIETSVCVLNTVKAREWPIPPWDVRCGWNLLNEMNHRQTKYMRVASYLLFATQPVLNSL